MKLGDPTPKQLPNLPPENTETIDQETLHLEKMLYDLPYVQRQLEHYRVVAVVSAENPNPEFQEVLRSRVTDVYGADPLLDKAISGELLEGDLRTSIKARLQQMPQEELERFRIASDANTLEEELVRLALELDARRNHFDIVESIEVEVDGKFLRPHYPRLATTLDKTIDKMENSFHSLAKLLREGSYPTVAVIDCTSWLLGDPRIAKRFDKHLLWEKVPAEELTAFALSNPHEYRLACLAGAAYSPKLLRQYLLTGKLPAIDGLRMSREDFIAKYGSESK